MNVARVALETTLLCHGVPRSRALDVAQRLFEVVRGQGAQPCLVGVLEGVVRSDLQLEDLEHMLSSDVVEKIGARGIPGAVARCVTAATTVSATMAIAAAAGIRVFATGGLGGVHRGAEQSFDESEDLRALSRYPVAVVSAGAKAILDLPKTLERLETLGVPVVGYGTTRFTAFYTNDSALQVAESVDDIAALARLVALRLQGPFGAGGVLVVNKVPAAADLGRDTAEQAVLQALAHAKKVGAAGGRATPEALAHLNALEGGRFLETNIAVVESNAELAARLAVAVAELP